MGVIIVLGDLFCLWRFRVENAERPNELPDVSHPIALPIKQFKYLSKLNNIV